ncbi:hypothetical protein VHUM_03620 [Vanrija humicola]|uniref:FAD dependent oxidoreductase domain-containing protein n=1 Tax=Vanrija humicola TaxID=5417 RepID=A0A7D8Z1C7_VANHU|nr:hypothetical protein VHUM_03620 [Vanrija humicola]
MPQQHNKSPFDVVVLGAGILGVATADALTEAGLRVAIVARDLPEDAHSAQFASPWAGANWSSFAANPAEQKRDALTFRRFSELSVAHPEIVRRYPFKYIWNTDVGYGSPWYKDVVEDFGPLDTAAVPKPYTQGVSFTSFCLNPARLNAHLVARLKARGVPFIRARLGSLDEAFAAVGNVDFVVNATGLGARTLLGVEDPAVFPIRGQTVLVRAPGVNTCFGVRDRDLPAGESCYIIPRPGSDGCVIVGGTFLPHNYSLLPERETAQRILQKAYAICPELAGVNGKSWEDIEIVSHNVGLRPAREGGLRLEIEEREIAPQRQTLVPELGRAAAPRSVAVLHCYGIGPAGYQASLGIAEEAKQLALGYLSKKAAKARL